jgi:2'-5' RNA ligase
MRLFAAIKLPEEIAGELRKLQKQISDDGLRFVKDFHLTLKFYGEVQEDKVGKLKEELSKVKFEPFEASLNGVGVFPNMHHINVVWLGLEPEQKFREIADQIEKDERFKAHITLARVKFLKDKPGFRQKLESVTVPKLSFKVDKFYLIKSTLTPEGPVYEDLAEFGQ